MLRVAVAGTGYFGRFQIDAWSRDPRVALAALCDLDTDRARAVAEAHGAPPAYDDIAAMLDEVRPDLLDIATPEATHAALVAEAAARGIDVVCQKPLAPDLAAASEMVRTAADAGIRLIVHENWRFQPWYREAKRLLDAGALGSPHGIAFRIRPGDGQGPRAYLDRQPYFQTMPRMLIHETGIHLVDTFRYLLGEATGVFARLRRLNPAIRGEDAGLVVLSFESGASGLIDGNRLNDHDAPDLRLTLGTMLLEGSDATLTLSGDGRLWLKPHLGDVAEHPFEGREAGPHGGSVSALQRHVVAHLLDGAPVESTGAAYLRNLEIEDAIYRSSETGRWIDLDHDTARHERA